MKHYWNYLSVSESKFKELMEENQWRCDAGGRAFMAEKVKVMYPRPILAYSPEVLNEAEKLGGLKPGMSFEYPNAQGGISTAYVTSLYDIPKDLVNPYLYVFSGVMMAPFYGMEILRFYAKQTGEVLPFVSSGKEGNKGLFKKLFYRETGLIRKTEYDAYAAIMAELAGKEYAYANYMACEDDDSEGNLIEMYEFAKEKGLDEITLVICSGNPFYDKRLLAEWMWQLKDKKFSEVRVNLVLAHCPLWYTFSKRVIPEAKISEIYLGYLAASLGPLAKYTIEFNGKTESAKPERYLMPGVADANWELFRDIIVDYSNMGWPNYQEILYGIDHKEAVMNIILADLFARASYTPKDYDNGIWELISNYRRFLGKAYDEKQSLKEYLVNTSNKKFF